MVFLKVMEEVEGETESSFLFETTTSEVLSDLVKILVRISNLRKKLRKGLALLENKTQNETAARFVSDLRTLLSQVLNTNN